MALAPKKAFQFNWPQKRRRRTQTLYPTNSLQNSSPGRRQPKNTREQGRLPKNTEAVLLGGVCCKGHYHNPSGSNLGIFLAWRSCIAPTPANLQKNVSNHHYQNTTYHQQQQRRQKSFRSLEVLPAAMQWEAATIPGFTSHIQYLGARPIFRRGADISSWPGQKKSFFWLAAVLGNGWLRAASYLQVASPQANAALRALFCIRGLTCFDILRGCTV